MAIQDDSSVALIPSAYGTSKVYSVIPSNGNGDFTFSRSGSATRVNKGGYIETMGSNVPRLDYPLIDGVVQDCPALLLEPSRTNVVPYSEQFDNAAWGKQAITVTANAAISPDGSQTADKIIPSASSTTHQIYDLSLISSQTCATSIFAKADGINTFEILDGSSAANGAFFNLSNGTFTNKGSGVGSMIYYGNGWYRCIVISTTTGYRIYCPSSASNASGDGSSGVLLWGATIEAGSYPTSYIPTSGSSVTRSADVCNGSGTSAEFNDSEGVLFAEVAFSDITAAKAISISDGSFQNRALFYLSTSGSLIVYTFVSNSVQCNISISNYDYETNNKIVLKYKENDFALWVNGFKRGTDTSGSIFSSGTLNELSFDANGAGADDFYGKTKQLMTFKTALTDSELETLTSWDSFNAMAKAQLYSIE